MSESLEIVFEPFKREVLPDIIVENIVNLIKAKKLLPGTRLPAERALAEQMNVGRPTVRAALRALATMNIIEIRPGSGAYISSLEPERLIEHVDFVFFLDTTTISQFYEARRTLELKTVVLAAQRITDVEIEHLETCLAQMQSSDLNGDVDNAVQHDQDFHKVIGIASRNPLLSRFVSIMTEIGREYRLQVHQLRGTADVPAADHRRILDALKDHDAKTARQAMLTHLTHSEEGHLSLVNSSINS